MEETKVTERTRRTTQNGVEEEMQWSRIFNIRDNREIRVLAEMIGDTNPLHHESEAAGGLNLPGIIAPGIMLLGFVSATIAGRIDKVRVRHMDVKFLKPVCAPALIRVHCIVSKQKVGLTEITVKLVNKQDVVAHGTCTVLLP